MKNRDEYLLKELAKKIKKQRIELGLSQEKLAHICDFDRTYISLLERAQRNPSYLSLEKLCVGLQLELSELLKGNKDNECT